MTGVCISALAVKPPREVRVAFTWNEESIGWYLDASAWGSFHSQLAALIMPWLDSGDTLCDLGCGLGRLSLALAPHVRTVTALDTDPAVVAALRRDAGLLGVRNLHARVQDAMELEESFDVALVSFFGRGDEMFRHFYSLGRKRVVQVVNSGNTGRLYPGGCGRGRRHNTPQTVRRLLEEEGLPYTLRQATIEFGQPFRSGGEAERFVRHYAPDADEEQTAGFLANSLRPTERAGFSCYLPNPKQVEVFVIETGQCARPR